MTDPGVTRKDVESWMRYFDEHAEEFVAAHEAIIRKAQPDAEPIQEIAAKYASRLHNCLLDAGFTAPRKQWLAAHFQEAIAALHSAEVPDRIKTGGPYQEALEFYAAKLEQRIVELEIKYGAPAGMLEAAEIADSFEDRHEVGDAIRARANLSTFPDRR